jgi:cell division protein FtsB
MVVTLAVLVLASFAFSDSLRKMVGRRRSISRAEAELADVTRRVAQARASVSGLKSDPQSYEPIVRRDLGYLRPGEREVRFVKDESKNP